MQRVLLVVGLLGLACLYIALTVAKSPPESPQKHQNLISRSRFAQSWWPMAAKTMWRYEVLGKGPFKTRGYFVQKVSSADIAMVFENTDGHQTDNFRVHSGPGDQVEFKEYQASKGSLLYFPETLEIGTRWNLREDLRARAEAFEKIEVPALKGPREALRIHYESFYSAEQTSSPGWYPSGTRWMVQGVGLVKEDLMDSDGPPELRDHIRTQQRIMHLIDFQAPWKP
jgi:hypothetical protein